MTDQELLKELRRAKAGGATHYYTDEWQSGIVLRGFECRRPGNKRWRHHMYCAGSVRGDRRISVVIKQLERRLARKIPLDKRGGGR
jgi:hypothetical protein